MRVDGQLHDLFRTVPADAEVEPVLIDTPDGLDILRHSTAHVLAQAVQQLDPEAKLGIGPPIADGFYYDFDVAEPFTPEDLKKLEKAMQRIINSGQTFARRVVSEDQAQQELDSEPYKLELIGLKRSEERRVGKEWRARWSAEQEKEKREKRRRQLVKKKKRVARRVK